MTVGVPRETKAGERRVALVPGDVAHLRRGRVLVERGAGVGAGYSDEAYRAAGAEVVETGAAWGADLVVKVKELQPGEEGRLGDGQILFCYTHLLGRPATAEALRAAGVSALDFQTVEDENGGTPLLEPMSVIAGRLAGLKAAELLQAPPGRGLLLGAPGEPGAVVVVGHGAAGRAARLCAEALGAEVTVFASSPRTEADGTRVRETTPEALRAAAATADAVIGTAFRPGAPSPRVLEATDLAVLRPGSVLIDVSIDGGGCFGSSRETTLDDPWFVEQGIVHYAVPNMPALAPVSASVSLSAAVRPYVDLLAGGLEQACAERPGLRRGLQVHAGEVVAEGL